MTKQEQLIEIIEASKFYFCAPLENVEKIAEKFIEDFANGKHLTWNSTPPAWLCDEVYSILEN